MPGTLTDRFKKVMDTPVQLETVSRNLSALLIVVSFVSVAALIIALVAVRRAD